MNAIGQRKYIAKYHHIEMVITSHDPKRVNFSENTAIHECLLVARRQTDRNNPTRFIQLARYPADVTQTETLIDAIQSGTPNNLYTETLWPAEKVRAGNWTPVQWMSPQLAKVADEIATISDKLESGARYAWRPPGRPSVVHSNTKKVKTAT